VSHIVGYGCAGFYVVALVAALRQSTAGDVKAGLVPLALALALLLASIALLRARENRL
jgi:hypothetical protein